MSMGYNCQTKVACIGNSEVGKSSLALRFCSGEWDPSFRSTIGVDFKYRIVDATTAIKFVYSFGILLVKIGILLTLWAFGVFDCLLIRGIYWLPLCAKATQRWLDDVDDAGVPEIVPRLLVGNKTDSSNRTASAEQGQSLAEKIGAQFCETSAKYGDGVTSVYDVGKVIYIGAEKNLGDPAYRRAVNDRGNNAFGPTRGKRFVRRPAPKSWYGGCGCSSH